jgi:hypothetical protein
MTEEDKLELIAIENERVNLAERGSYINTLRIDYEEKQVREEKRVKADCGILEELDEQVLTKPLMTIHPPEHNELENAHCMRCGAKLCKEARNVRAWYIMRVGVDYFIAYVVRCNQCDYFCGESKYELQVSEVQEIIIRETESSSANVTFPIRAFGIFCHIGDVNTFLFRTMCVLLIHQYNDLILSHKKNGSSLDNPILSNVITETCSQIIGYITRGIRSRLFSCSPTVNCDIIILTNTNDVGAECAIILDSVGVRNQIFYAKKQSADALFTKRFAPFLRNAIWRAEMQVLPVQYDGKFITINIV